jgi:hypothetical protein
MESPALEQVAARDRTVIAAETRGIERIQELVQGHHFRTRMSLKPRGDASANASGGNVL